VSSVHVLRQMQRRGIPRLIVQWLEEFGEEVHDHHGAIILHFSKAARRRLERFAGRQAVRKLDEWMNAYLVIATDGTPITAGFRYRRIYHRTAAKRSTVAACHARRILGDGRGLPPHSSRSSTVNRLGASYRSAAVRTPGGR